MDMITLYNIRGVIRVKYGDAVSKRRKFHIRSLTTIQEQERIQCQMYAEFYHTSVNFWRQKWHDINQRIADAGGDV
jgi:hypothetical protein